MKRASAIVLGACCASATAAPKAPLLVGPSPAWVTISTEELRGAFDTLWAVSDVHGRLRELDQLLLAANLVTRWRRERHLERGTTKTALRRGRRLRRRWP